MTAWLLVENWHGKAHVAIAFYEPSSDERLKRPRPLRIALPVGDEVLPLAVLRRLYAAEIASYMDTEAGSKKLLLLREAAVKRERLVKTLRGIVATSQNRGEVETAKAALRKLET